MGASVNNSANIACLNQFPRFKWVLLINISMILILALEEFTEWDGQW